MKNAISEIYLFDELSSRLEVTKERIIEIEDS